MGRVRRGEGPVSGFWNLAALKSIVFIRERRENPRNNDVILATFAMLEKAKQHEREVQYFKKH
jgi:hypothetical protein